MTDLERLFPKVWRTNEGFRALCPACGETKGKLYFNTEKRCGCCFEADCKWNPSRGGVTESQLRDALKYSRPESPTEIIEKAEMSEVELPKEFKLLKDLDEDLGETIYAYLESRGLVRRVLDRMKVGYCKSGPQWGCIIFPVVNADDEIVYWQGRRFKKRERKFFNPEASYKSELLYTVGKTRVRGYRGSKVILVESIINALTIGWPDGRNLIVALLGSSMSDSQFHQLLLYRIDEVVVALDGDVWKQAVAIANRLLGAFRIVRIAKFPYDRDINVLGREKSWSIIDGAEVYHGEMMSVTLKGTKRPPWEREGRLTYEATIP